MTKFFILRHGETEWNHDHNRYCGRTDISLTDTGIKQALAAADALSGISFDQIYASPLKRARETATVIKNARSLSPEIKTDERLIEIDFGKWEGLIRSEIKSQFADGWAKWFNDPTDISAGETGESARAVSKRAEAFYLEASELHPEATILVVAHNTVNRLFITGSLGLPFSQYRKLVQSNTGISILEVNEAKEILWHQLNSHMHLL